MDVLEPWKREWATSFVRAKRFDNRIKPIAYSVWIHLRSNRLFGGLEATKGVSVRGWTTVTESAYLLVQCLRFTMRALVRSVFG